MAKKFKSEFHQNLKSTKFFKESINIKIFYSLNLDNDINLKNYKTIVLHSLPNI